MASKIIQKEKERQDKCLGGCNINNPLARKSLLNYCGWRGFTCDRCKSRIESHKQSLINLREYMAAWLSEMWDLGTDFQNWIDRLTEDIEKIDKMIEKYDVKGGNLE